MVCAMKKAGVLSILFVVVLLAVAVIADANRQAKSHGSDIVSNRVKPTAMTPDLFEDAFRQGLRNLGYIEAKNILIEYRYAEGAEDRLPTLVSELLQLKVDLLFSATIRGIRAARQATKTIPIVIVTTADPVAAGLIDSLAHPGGNITGVTRFTRDVSGKRLELLKEVIPEMSRVGVLSDASGVATELKGK
jgi:putative ABC transport system substrate-binding protein